MFALADQPFLTAADTGRSSTPGCEQRPLIVGSRFGEVTAPPHLFDRALYPELAVLQHGARSVLQRHADAMIVLRFASELLLDIDTPEDYERAKARASPGGEGWPWRRRGPPANPRWKASISARMETATSSGVSAPSASPTGLCTRRHLVRRGTNPARASSASNRSNRARGPSTPT